MGASSVLLIVCMSVFASLASEGLNWFFIYRHDSYKQAKAKVARAQARVDALKSQVANVKKRHQQEKQIAAAERDVSALSLSQTRSQIVTSVLMAVAFIANYQFMSSYFGKEVVATSPFEPISMLQAISHRGLEGEDFSQVGFAWIYMLCSMGTRPIISKLIGNNAASGPSLWNQQWERVSKEAKQKGW